ncbi:hypothetical protein KSP35_14015 [Aquihabitans sp. G128]|uniref:hypothetical protein n=1 Tax=Aquihabitans sp. G128 TaxID=2849779 RepID=UPI001C219A62|nr:hypothetical protein [Aquihabitans sp. G128]QXC63618.1 hypothetical protein KSP35_14015 [Aquihabitans sp. G128]
MIGRRTTRATTGLVVSVAVALGALAACKPPPPAVSLSGSTVLPVADDATVTFTLRCAGAKACTGETRVRVGTVDGPVRAYSVAAAKTSAIVVKLSTAQLAAAAPGTTVAGQVRLKEQAPAALEARGVAVTVQRPELPPEETPTSKAYRERNWTPTSYDTCSAAFHRSFSVIGPDGKLYPTWHPATAVDPTTGLMCSFGHEHGDDPGSSDLYTWVTDFLDAKPTESRGIPFGYVSEALDTYASTRDNVTRHEDNVGHKIIVANDVKLVTASPRGVPARRRRAAHHLRLPHQGAPGLALWRCPDQQRPRAAVRGPLHRRHGDHLVDAGPLRQRQPVQPLVRPPDGYHRRQQPAERHRRLAAHPGPVLHRP